MQPCKNTKINTLNILKLKYINHFNSNFTLQYILTFNNNINVPNNAILGITINHIQTPTPLTTASSSSSTAPSITSPPWATPATAPPRTPWSSTRRTLASPCNGSQQSGSRTVSSPESRLISNRSSRLENIYIKILPPLDQNNRLSTTPENSHFYLLTSQTSKSFSITTSTSPIF